MKEQFDRSVRFFGAEGQEKMSGVTVCVAGAGGLGSHVIQQLAYLGVQHFIIIDPEYLDITNLNRYVGATMKDALAKIAKVDLAERIILSVNPDAKVTKLQDTALCEAAFELIKTADYLIGCFDDDGPRFVMNELCVAYEIPYIDLASDIHTEGGLDYGGRIATILDGDSCLACIEDLDQEEIQNVVNDPKDKEIKKAIYGVQHEFLSVKGPSVVSLNGVIASLAVTELIAIVTGIREAKRYITYRGDMTRITTRNERHSPDCFCCNVLRGLQGKANIERYVNILGKSKYSDIGGGSQSAGNQDDVSTTEIATASATASTKGV